MRSQNVVLVGPRIFQYDQRVRARMRLALASIDSAANGRLAIVVQYQVRVSTRAVEPALDLPLRFCDRCAHGMLSGQAVGVSRCAGDAGLALQTLAQLDIGLPHVFAQDVSAGGLVLG